MRTKLGQLKNSFGVLVKTGRLVRESARGWTVLWLLVLALTGFLPVALMKLIKGLVDALTVASRSGYSMESMRPAAILGVLICGGILLLELLQGLGEWLRTIQAELLQDRISALVQTKSAEVDLAFYETPGCYDQMYRARDEAQTRPTALLDSVGSLLQNGVSLLLICWVVASYSLWLLIAMALCFAPAFLIVARYNWLNHEWWQETTAERRWIQYYDDKFVSAAAAPEMRLFRLGPVFRDAYQVLRDQLRGQRLKLIERQTRDRMVAALAGLAAGGGAVGWMCLRMVHGQASLGDLALFYQAFSGGQSVIRLLTGSLGQAFANLLRLQELFRFLELPTAVVDPPLPIAAPATLEQGIRFENVTFRYPDSERASLRDLSLEIPAGKIVAIVGPNGAGKSTIVKLLCRFYDPTEGRITFDDMDVRKMSLDAVRGMSSVLFQIPGSYDATAADNIAIGTTGPQNSPLIERAARASGAHDLIAALPLGYQSRLGKAFADGNELSAGEWQRVAMARAFYRQTPLVLLDEPTSFMDPWAEADWFARLRNLAQGRTCVVITHRFTIAMRADLIHVLQKGSKVESGTHSQLVARDGLYARSWKDQVSDGKLQAELVMSR
jgi:ATP-binding cassette subfamily B protein